MYLYLPYGLLTKLLVAQNLQRPTIECLVNDAMDMEGSPYSLTGPNILAFALRNWGYPRDTSIRVVGVPVKIRNGHVCRSVVTWSYFLVEKVEFSLYHATKYVYRVWTSATTRPLYLWDGTLVPFVQEARWAPAGREKSHVPIADHTLWDSSGRVISSTQRSLPDSTLRRQETYIHAPGWVRTRNPSKRAAADSRHRPHDQ